MDTELTVTIAKDYLLALEEDIKLKRLQLELWETWGIVEIMARNPNIDSWVKEKEKYISDLECKVKGRPQRSAY